MAHDLTETMNVRLSTADVERLDRITARMPLRRGQLARALMRIGAELVERDPLVLFQNKESS